ncbi:TIGR00282 family metallophosphoesterase [Mycoplasmopsis synoviae]|uniref:Uncharacterized protein n=4 Tax=Mycoplasmopsis TaxID=2767358 RepID=Q4A5K3_MYCS5|nr:TIGR00282 family metallophosphoesterase [Mycoplasmopsis synoviae]AAZ43968.2 conserved hypothetical protein [Mycoplasmopsis synoviae 53]AKJ20784.1 Phosphoesterase [Mycoplasmopsis synoviae]AQU48107.1 Phosphoesterase [Mycoplasmopsis synoviae]AWL84334.1 metallophosphatase [Mycoplasmopsis synoviae]MBD5788413.1 hypothetical protein [Mycoplasmopsis synoviae GX11-T]
MKLKILFVGDIFGEPGILALKKILPKIIFREKIDFIIAQGENVSGRKGLSKKDFDDLLKLNVNCITMGNHIWSNSEIYEFINNPELIRPLNVEGSYPGKGSRIYNVKKYNLRVTAILGRAFNVLNKPWDQAQANDFFDAFDSVISSEEKVDFDFVDFHAETTSEKYVFGLYLDGKVDAFCGTHTHVQTNDAKILPNGTAYITDVGMTGPQNSAIGANFEEVYKKMRFNGKEKFKVSDNDLQFNAVVITLNKNKKTNQKRHKIKLINISDIKK